MLRKINNEKGSIIVLSIFIFVILIGVTGVVVDGGIAYANKLHIQKATAAAALSGAQELLNDEDECIQIIKDIMVANHIDLQNVEYSIANNEVSVYARNTNETYFIKLFGKKSVSVSAESTAALVSKSSGSGAMPIGVDSGLNLVVGKTYPFTFDEINEISGWFGALIIDGNGANVYKNTLINGATRNLKVGDILDIKPGIMTGSSRTAVSAKINACSHQTIDECRLDDCSRVMFVPIYEPYEVDGDALRKVEIKGFAYFYLHGMGQGNKTIIGEFIEKSSAGEGDSNVTNYGAYSIKLK